MCIRDRRHIYYDHDLKIEAYQLRGIVQKFPNHFHEYYVIGFIKGGRRHLQCKGQESVSYTHLDVYKRQISYCPIN